MTNTINAHDRELGSLNAVPAARPKGWFAVQVFSEAWGGEFKLAEDTHGEYYQDSSGGNWVKISNIMRRRDAESRSVRMCARSGGR